MFFSYKTLSELRSLQSRLDSAIRSKTNNHLHDTSTLFAHVLALIVEISELSNELKTFKHWQTNKNVDFEKIAVEYVDVLHFVLSLSNYFKIKTSHLANCEKLFIGSNLEMVGRINHINELDFYDHNLNLLLFHLNYEVCLLQFSTLKTNNFKEIQQKLTSVFYLVDCLGFLLFEDEVTVANHFKNKVEINYKRINKEDIDISFFD